MLLRLNALGMCHDALKPDAGKFDVYFNIDNGGGRLLGIYAENNLEAALLFKSSGVAR